MSGETEHVSLRNYVERIFDEREKALNLAFRAQQEALAIATTALDRELSHLNELRQEVTRDRAIYVTIERFQAFDDALDKRLKVLESLLDRAAGRGAGITSSFGWMIAIATVAAGFSSAIVYLIIHK